MEILKYIGIAVYIIVCIAIIILTVMQSEKHGGASGTIMGNSNGEGNFYEKNKGRTKEGKIKRWTLILSIVFVVLTLGLGILWVAVK